MFLMNFNKKIFSKKSPVNLLKNNLPVIVNCATEGKLWIVYSPPPHQQPATTCSPAQPIPT